MEDEKIEIEILDKISPSVRKKIVNIQNSATKAGNAIERLKKELLNIDSSAITRLSAETSKLTNAKARLLNAENRSAEFRIKEQTALERSLLNQQKLKTETEKTSIAFVRKKTAVEQLRAATARAEKAWLSFRNAQERVNVSSFSLIRGIKKVIGTIAILGGFSFGGANIIKSLDSYDQLQNKLRNVTETQGQLNKVTEENFRIAIETRSNVLETAKAFQRFDKAIQELGGGQKESLRITETINKSIILSGANSGEAAAGLLQLSQAFNKGKLDGDEFRTVMELMPDITKALQKELKATKGELLDLAPKGKITAEVLRRALANAADDIDEKFSELVPTVGQAINNLFTNLTKFLGESNKGIGINYLLSNSIIFLSENLNGLLVVVTAVSAAIATKFIPSMLFANSIFSSFISFVAKNPLIIAVAAITGLISYIISFRDELGKTKKDLTSIGDSFKVSLDFIRKELTSVLNFWKKTLSTIKKETEINFFVEIKKGIISLVAGFNGLISVGARAINFFKGIKDPVSASDRFFETYNETVKNLTDNMKNLTEAEGKLRGNSSNTITVKPDFAAVELENLLKQIELLRMSNKEREISSNLSEIENRLAQKGIELNFFQKEIFKDVIEAKIQSQKISEEISRLDAQAGGEGALDDLKAKSDALTILFKKRRLETSFYTAEIGKLGIEFAKMNIIAGNADWADVTLASLEQFTSGFKSLISNLADSFDNFFTSLKDGFASSIGDLIAYHQSFKDFKSTLDDIARRAVSDLIASLIKMGIEFVALKAVASVTAASAQAETSTMAAQTAAAWTPAAAAASLATEGTNAGPAAVAIATTLALAIALFAATQGFREGGYTGSGGLNDVAGVVHRKEYVMPAGPTEKYRDVLEAMRSGNDAAVRQATKGNVVFQSQQNRIDVKIDNYGNSKIDAFVDNQNRLRIIAREEASAIVRRDAPKIIANDLQNPNSRTSKSLKLNTNIKRNIS